MTSGNRPAAEEEKHKPARSRIMPRTIVTITGLAGLVMLGAGLIYATSEANVTNTVHLDYPPSTTDVFPTNTDGKTFCDTLAGTLTRLAGWEIDRTGDAPASGRGLKITASANSVCVATVKMAWGHYNVGKFIVEKMETTGVQSYDARLSAGNAEPVARQIIRAFGKP